MSHIIAKLRLLRSPPPRLLFPFILRGKELRDWGCGVIWNIFFLVAPLVEVLKRPFLLAGLGFGSWALGVDGLLILKITTRMPLYLQRYACEGIPLASFLMYYLTFLANSWF